MVLNMGPQHPSTHGVLRVILEMDGETLWASGRISGICTPESRKLRSKVYQQAIR